MKRTALVIAALAIPLVALWRWLWRPVDERLTAETLARIRAEYDGAAVLEEQLGAPVIRRRQRRPSGASQVTAYTRTVDGRRG